jgi:hypothetical protein
MLGSLFGFDPFEPAESQKESPAAEQPQAPPAVCAPGMMPVCSGMDVYVTG